MLMHLPAVIVLSAGNLINQPASTTQVYAGGLSISVSCEKSCKLVAEKKHSRLVYFFELESLGYKATWPEYRFISYGDPFLSKTFSFKLYAECLQTDLAIVKSDVGAECLVEYIVSGDRLVPLGVSVAPLDKNAEEGFRYIQPGSK